MRFNIKEQLFGSLIGPAKKYWVVYDTTNDEILFGNNQPRDKQEAEQCCRAANLAVVSVRNELNDSINDVLRTYETTR